jgi:hypothetical protein
VASQPLAADGEAPNGHGPLEEVILALGALQGADPRLRGPFLAEMELLRRLLQERGHEAPPPPQLVSCRSLVRMVCFASTVCCDTIMDHVMA